MFAFNKTQNIYQCRGTYYYYYYTINRKRQNDGCQNVCTKQIYIIQKAKTNTNKHIENEKQMTIKNTTKNLTHKSSPLQQKMYWFKKI